MDTTDGATAIERPRFGVLRQRDFRLLWLGETTSGLGTSITTVALPLIAVVVLKSDTFAVGALAAAVWLPWLVIGLPVGAWVDRMRRRPLMIACDLAAALLYASVPVAAWCDALTYTHLLVVALACGVASVFFSTAYHAFLPAVLDGRDLLEGNAKLQGSEAGTRVLGRGAAGLIAQAFGAVLGLLVDAVTFLISTVCLALLRVREPAPENPVDRTTLRRRIGEGLRFVLHDRYLRPMVVYGAVANLALMGYQAVQIVFLVRTVGANPATVGVLIMIGSLGGVLGALLAGAVGRRFGTARGMLAMQAFTGPFALLLPLTVPGAGLLLFALGGFTVGTGITACNVVLGSFRQTYCPPRLLGRVVATTMVINHSTIPLGSLLGGWLGDAVGLRPTMWIMTGLLAPCWLILALSPMRGRRDLPQGYGPVDGRTADAGLGATEPQATGTAAEECAADVSPR
ncbi:MFS transporter [Streptomyces palmae]|uniref:MFS transporter n=1 Tax=Streptomyces palmae TaxID=1701085 RepID=A0A4Z0HEJ9_9ACTN|nr:MFS transporter [Streptomyces palmae]TGB12305.1 MFS transporter [Streptomyces palmae]